jgi:hypothetical protein
VFPLSPSGIRTQVYEKILGTEMKEKSENEK